MLSKVSVWILRIVPVEIRCISCSCRQLASIQSFKHSVTRVWTSFWNNKVVLEGSSVTYSIYFWLGTFSDISPVLVHVLDKSRLSFVHGVANTLLRIVKPRSRRHWVHVVHIAWVWCALVCKSYLRLAAVYTSSTWKLASLVFGI